MRSFTASYLQACLQDFSLSDTMDCCSVSVHRFSGSGNMGEKTVAVQVVF